MYKEQFHFFSKALAEVFLLLGFMSLVQSCGSVDDSFTDSLTEFETAQADALPFAFDVDIDHIAYMSCEGESVRLSSGPYFNFKAGAFNSNMGVKFRDNFLSSVGSLAGNKEKLSEYLAISKRNADTGLIMSVRTAGDFREPFRFESDPNKLNFLSEMFGDSNARISLTDPNFISLMFDSSGGVNYFSGVPGTSPNKTLDATLSFNGSGAQKAIRTALQNDSYLSFTFATDDDQEPGVKARSPFDETGSSEDAKTSIFGKGYKMTFAQYDPLRVSSPQAVLSSVQGFDLESNGTSNGETWHCPKDEQYIIVRPEDAKRRFDLAPGTRADGPDADTDPDENNPWDGALYDDGGKGTGGYYMEFLEDDPNNPGTNIKVKHKVLCPTVPDNIASNSSEHSVQAWKRVRNILSVKDWYVFRGDRYHCIVPKNDDGNACYGAFAANDNTGANPNSNLNNEVRYFGSEDSIDKKLRDNKIFVDTLANDPDSTIKRTTYDPIRDCEATTGDGSSKYCPKILSVCYKQ